MRINLKFRITKEECNSQNRGRENCCLSKAKPKICSVSSWQSQGDGRWSTSPKAKEGEDDQRRDWMRWLEKTWKL